VYKSEEYGIYYIKVKYILVSSMLKSGKTIVFFILAVLGTVMGDHVILDPPAGASGTSVAIIWIHGM